MTPVAFLRALLGARLAPDAMRWLEASTAEIGAGASVERFCALFSQAARHARRDALAPSVDERAQAAHLVEGWNPERWSVLESVRVVLILSRSDLAGDGGPRALSEAFRYTDEGELCALLRSLALLPGAERYAWRAGEGCRSNMRSVFEAAALDTPYPARHFDELTWRQCVIKCLFVGAPLWRLWGLDERLSPELARMALDLADERRSAGRPVPHELWLCLGKHGGTRGLAALELELAPANPNIAGRCAAALALSRAGEKKRLEQLAAGESHPAVRAALARVRAGETGATAFQHLEAVRA
jgi:hypothetical protein